MIAPEIVGGTGPVEPVAVGPGGPEASSATGSRSADPSRAPDGGDVPGQDESRAPDGGDASLLALVDRLTGLLERSDLGELEMASGGTTIILRAPSAIERRAPAAAAVTEAPFAGPPAPLGSPVAPTAPVVQPSVRAPLTGIYYGAPSPGATPYVSVGDHVAIGQIIGLIEAMKLFNEIKSDLAGRVVRICADSGALVKARQVLIEVEPA